MEGSESAINRVGRAMWTVWGYLTGAVGRYLRPEARNEEAQNVQQEDTVPISKSYKELKVKDEEKERAETKMREDLQYPGVRVRAAAVQWEQGNFAHHEDKVKSTGLEAGDEISQMNEKTPADTSGSHGGQCSEQEDSPANIDADGKNQDRTCSGSEEFNLIVERNETDQEQSKSPEEEEKITRRKSDETEQPIKGDQGLLAKEPELNVVRSESNQITTKKPEEESVEIVRTANDETGEELTNSESIEQVLLAKEAELNVERSEICQEAERKQEAEGVDDDDDDDLMKNYDDAGEELTNSQPKEADLNVERNKNNQEQEREKEDEIMCRKNDETEEDLVFKEDDLNVKRDEQTREQRRESQEEEEEGSVNEILRGEYKEREEDPIDSDFSEQGLLAKEPDLHVERDEKYQEREEEEEDAEIMEHEKDETEEEPIQSEFIDLDVVNVERSECSLEQGRGEKEEGVNEILRGENEETKKDLIKSEFIDQGSLAKEADLNDEKNESSQEQRRKEEEEDVDEMMTTENDKSEKDTIQSEFMEKSLLAKEADLNAERDENDQEQGREENEEEEDDEIRTKESEEEPIQSEFINQEVLNVQRSECSLEQAKEEEEEDVDEMLRRENQEIKEKAIKIEFIGQDLLTKKSDLNDGWSENKQVQIREEEDEKEEEDVEIMKSENDEPEDPFKSEFTEQGLLAKEADLNVERNQEQGREEEDEIMCKENNETEEDLLFTQEQRRESQEEEQEILRREEEPIESEQGLLAKESDPNVERDEKHQEQEREEEDGKIPTCENDETEEEPVQSQFVDLEVLNRGECSLEQEMLKIENEEKDLIKSEFNDRGLLAKEKVVNVERDENYQEPGRKEEDGEIQKCENDEREEEPIQSEIIDLDVFNVERSEYSLEQGKEEEDVELMKGENEETEEEPIESEFIERSLLAKGADVIPERDEIHQEQGRKQKEEDAEMMKGENDEAEKAQSVEMRESSQEQRKTEEGVDPILRKEKNEIEEEAMVTDQGFDPEEPGATAEVHMASVDTIIEHDYNQDNNNELNVEEQICHVTTEHENKACKSQMVDEPLFLQLTSTRELRDPLIPSLDLEEEIPDSATLLQEKEVIEVHTEETMLVGMGNEKDGYHEGFSDTGIVEQKVCGMEMKETLKEVIDGDVETECKPLARTQMENAEMCKKTSEPSSVFEDEGNTLEMQQSEQCEEQKATSEQEHDREGSQRPEIVTKQDFEGVDTQPETETGNQKETVETTSKFRAEVAAVDMKKSAERETTLPADKEEVAAQEIMGHEHRSLQEDLVSAQTRIIEAPLSGVKSIPLEETVVDEIKGSSLQDLVGCSSEAELNRDVESSSPDQTSETQPECEISLENDDSVVSKTPVETRISQDEITEQEASSHGLSEIESEPEPMEMQTDPQKDTEERKKPVEADNRLVEEVKDVASCLGVEEEIKSVLSKDSEDSERELEDGKVHGESESCEETTESSMNVELLSDTRECEAESVDVEPMIDSTSEEEPIHQEEEMEKYPSESEASKEIGRGHEESVVDSKEDVVDKERSGLKRGFEKITGDNDKDKPSALRDLILPSQASSLDFTVQKSKIAVKNPLVRPPKDPRTLINMASVEPLTPHPPQPSLPGFLKKSPVEGASLPGKGVMGFKLPGLGSGFPALRKTETGGKIRGRDDSESVSSQKPDSDSQSEDDNVKRETSPQKPKWTPPRQPGMGNPMMMAELKSKLKKPAKE